MTLMKILSVSSALLLAAWAPAFSATPPPPGAPSFGEAVEVNVVNIDVYATDKQGHRVTGLGKDDFELLEDGKRVTISNFEVVDGGQGAAVTAAAPAAAGSPAAPGAPEDALNLVVYFDDFNLGPAHRARAVKQ